MHLKQIIVIRRDLKMRRGKEVAQGAHAAMAFLLSKLSGDQNEPCELSEAEQSWMQTGQKKICVRVNSEAELLEVHQRAIDSHLTSHLIKDSGRTEFAGRPTFTCCAIGPNLSDEIDQITGELELM